MVAPVARTETLTVTAVQDATVTLAGAAILTETLTFDDAQIATVTLGFTPGERRFLKHRGDVRIIRRT
jgi:hypothetical protein